MHQLPKRCLYLSSFLLLLLFAACKISKYKHKSCSEVALTEQVLTPIIKLNQPLKYKATIDVLKNHLSGILIVKKTDSVTTHFVFVTELGMKMFDFSYANNKMNAVFVFDPLNKPKLISSLMRNFEYMFLLRHFMEQRVYECKNDKQTFYVLERFPGEKTHEYFNIDNSRHIQQQENFSGRKITSKVDYVFSQSTNSYSHISCKKHGLVEIYVDLVSI